MTCAEFHFQPKPIKNQIKTKALQCKFENLKQLKMWATNGNLPATKVVDIEKLCKFDVQHFFHLNPENRENFRLPRGP